MRFVVLGAEGVSLVMINSASTRIEVIQGRVSQPLQPSVPLEKKRELTSWGKGSSMIEDSKELTRDFHRTDNI